MPKSLEELEQSPDVGLAERRVNVCLSAKLAEELERVTGELFELRDQIKAARAEAVDEDAPRAPKRMGATGPIGELEERAKAKAAEGDALRERIADNSVEVLLCGKPNGEWRQWASKHPARDEDEDPTGAARDQMWAGGFCNIDALVADLYLFTASYNGFEPSEKWRTLVTTKGAPANLTLAASRVVGMHEQVVDAGKSLVAWWDDQMSVSA